MIIDFLLGVAVPFILFLGGFYLIKTYRDDAVVKWVKIAVTAAEQIYKGSGKGKEKFAYVEKWISDKFKIPPEDLKNIIESAVFEMNKELKGE
ncbi:MAG: hypothetical protein IJN43_07725 [Ruminococcus sp.]|nr:hypothetical protein [Ruminococcus sp.]